MEKKLTVVIADGSGESGELLCKTVNAHGRFAVVGVTQDGVKARELIRKHRPDYLVLDLLLVNRDGISILKDLGDAEKKPIVIVISSFISTPVVSMAADLGAAYFLRKPFDVQLLLDRMEELAGPEEVHSEAWNWISPRLLEASTLLRQEITMMLREFGIPTHVKGYRYLCEALLILLEAPYRKKLNITTELYPRVAETFGTTPNRVERAMRHAIELAWYSEANEECIMRLHSYFDNRWSRPSNSEFLTAIAEKIRRSDKINLSQIRKVN